MLPPHSPSYNFILFEIDFDVKFPLLCLLLFLSDLKSTILCINVLKQIKFSIPIETKPRGASDFEKVSNYFRGTSKI